jgi:hypothetical protein
MSGECAGTTSIYCLVRAPHAGELTVRLTGRAKKIAAHAVFLARCSVIYCSTALSTCRLQKS